MGVPELLAPESLAATHQPIPRRATEIQHAHGTTSVLCEGGATILLPRLVGAHVQKGNELVVAQCAESSPGRAEVLIRKPNLKRADIYHTRAGYAAQPKPDRRGEMFVRVEVVASQLGVRAIHIPCQVIRDYFFAANRSLPWNCQEPLYRFLRLTHDASFDELRLGFRIRRMELKQTHASRTDFATLERAYNLLADPQLRAAYNELLIKPDAPVPFPYSGFGSLLVEGAPEGDTFFAGRILAFLPEHRRRTFTFPLRKLDFFSDYAIIRDPHRKLEVLIDHQLLPLKWDQTWSQWRHLISGDIEISADFVRTGKYRKQEGKWRLAEWESALPSRTEIKVLPGTDESILKARNTHSRFGRYSDEIDRLRWHVQQIPTECDELRRRCWGHGLPGDFDVIQITWRPDYDPYYYEELSKRARTMYLFREEYIFDLEKCVVVEVPQAGHATYVFAKPPRFQEFVWQYAKTTRQDILANRHNVAERLGFVGRVVHGANKAEWLKELCLRIREPETDHYHHHHSGNRDDPGIQGIRA
jgi:hypothetical protein